MKRGNGVLRWLMGAVLVFSSVSCQAAPKTVRIGYFPNLTHAQALVARENNSFEKSFGSQASVEWSMFNAGPSVIEAIFAGQLDIAYVGPSPAVNGYIKSNGEALRVIAGAAGGGAALVVRNDADIHRIEDFHGKRLASPQLGNTQDVSLRAWVLSNGLQLKDKGGDIEIHPVSNADQLSLFLKKELDASWTVEPWVSIFLEKAETRIFLEESSLYPSGKYATTLVVVRKKFLDENPSLVKEFLKTHLALTSWICLHPEEAKSLINRHLERVTRKPVAKSLLDAAFSRINFTEDPMIDSVKIQAESAYKVGFLKKTPQIEGMFDMHFLEEVRSKDAGQKQ